MQTFGFQAQLGQQFEDFYVKARNYKEALEKAKRSCPIKHRFVNIVSLS